MGSSACFGYTRLYVAAALAGPVVASVVLTGAFWLLAVSELLGLMRGGSAAEASKGLIVAVWTSGITAYEWACHKVVPWRLRVDADRLSVTTVGGPILSYRLADLLCVQETSRLYPTSLRGWVCLRFAQGKGEKRVYVSKHLIEFERFIRAVESSR